MKSRCSLIAALGFFLLGGVVAMACTSPERAYGPDTVSTSSGSGGGSSTGATMSTGTGTTTMIPCAVPSDCPGKETECQTRTCTGGMCGVSFSPAGVGIVSQNGGDCQKIVCDGKGDLTQQVDDTDVPVDSNPCTQDVCGAGVSSNPAVAFGTTCGGTLTCDNKGNCTGCAGPGECPGADTDCQTRSCTSGVCGFLYTPPGTKVTEQTPYDCKKNVCNGKGAVSVTFEAGDLQDDSNECTLDGCSNGSPTHANLAAGAPCTDPSKPVCNGSGACVACLSAAACPGQDTECQTRTCTGGVCGVAFAPLGAPVQVQSPGDCKKTVCNGGGGVAQDVDDGDVQQDGNPCTTDTCSNGAIVHAPVAASTDCGAPKKCDAAGNCAGCFTAADCAGQDNACQTRACTSGICGFSYVPSGTPVAAQTSGDCKTNVCDGAGNVTVALEGGDLASDGNECTTDVCSNGVPSYPPSPAGSACSSGGTLCNGNGSCGVCIPGDYQYCCGAKTSFCCEPIPVAPAAGLESRKASGASYPEASDPLIPPGGACCCGGTIYCDSTGHWGPCQN